jgi:hypothetical protein
VAGRVGSVAEVARAIQAERVEQFAQGGGRVGTSAGVRQLVNRQAPFSFAVFGLHQA